MATAHDFVIKPEDFGPYFVPKKVQYNEKCPYCKKAAVPHKTGYPCRICANVFHKKCVIREMRSNEKEVDKLLTRCYDDHGWSCPTCDNPFNLLTVDEMNRILDLYEKIDANHRGMISFDDFMAFEEHAHLELYGKPMDDFEQNLAQTRFKTIDSNHSKDVDLREFQNYQAMKFLERKGKKTLVNFLTPSEKVIAKNVFVLMDVNHDGRVSVKEAQEFFRHFYAKHMQQHHQAEKYHIPKPALEKKKLDQESLLRARSIVSSDETTTGEFVDWPGFLRGQALNLLSSRANHSTTHHTLPEFKKITKFYREERQHANEKAVQAGPSRL